MTILYNCEYWRSISEYRNYEVSSCGRVRNAKTSRILKPSDSSGYYHVVLCKNGKVKSFHIHRLVAEAFLENPNDFKYIDHRDGNKINNNYENLRFCSISQNAMNKKKSDNCSSTYKGVYFNKRCRKWHVQIMIDGKRKHIGLFESEKEAAKMYNEKAIELFGDFAKLNDISDSDDENTDEENTEDDNTEENET